MHATDCFFRRKFALIWFQFEMNKCYNDTSNKKFTVWQKSLVKKSNIGLNKKTSKHKLTIQWIGNILFDWN
jgi:hypothetical protein